MKKYRFIIIIIILIIILIAFSLINSPSRQRQNEIEEEVLDYLKDKYHEEFTIVSYTSTKNSCTIEEDDEYETKEMNDSYIYNLEVKSSRLIEFQVIYIYYSEEEYEKYKDYNIQESGIYDNYIYFYQIKNIKSSLKEEIYNTMTNSKNLDISFDDISLGTSNIMIKYSSFDDDKKELYDLYNSLGKTTSMDEYYQVLTSIDEDCSIILEFDINSYITDDNLDELKEELASLVNYLQDLDYLNYDINISFKNYVSARATRYLDNNKEQIYLIFEYADYSDITDENKLTAYVIDK